MQTLRILLTPETEGEGTNVKLLTCWTWLDRTRGLRENLNKLDNAILYRALGLAA